MVVVRQDPECPPRKGYGSGSGPREKLLASGQSNGSSASVLSLHGCSPVPLSKSNLSQQVPSIPRSSNTSQLLILTESDRHKQYEISDMGLRYLQVFDQMQDDLRPANI